MQQAWWGASRVCGQGQPSRECVREVSVDRDRRRLCEHSSRTLVRRKGDHRRLCTLVELPFVVPGRDEYHTAAITIDKEVTLTLGCDLFYVGFRKLPTCRLQDEIGMPLDAGCLLKHIL
ncbi:unnamed protein product [Callosobruchus maculatus]|uniref:Uncharacterized protein n=1 Tax=Callosobruchus maculatus TaxID=64391 RepID=A0A653C320_CALMS|nr:unnamed protein product [Callosobruchus maculatus]